MNITLIAILYLLLGFIISLTISYNYLKYYPDENVNFAFYFTVIIFGFVIFFIFLIPFDITISVLDLDSKFLKYLPMYYLIFGYFSKIMGDLVSPILILVETSGLYTKSDIFKDVLKRFLKEYISLFKFIFLSSASIPTVSYYISKKVDVFKLFRTILLYLNFFPYLEMLYYIGFVCQDLAYSYIRQQPPYRFYYDIWKLGKIYKYYERERLIVKSRTQKIEDIKNDIKYDIPKEFQIKNNKLKINITNINNIN